MKIDIEVERLGKYIGEKDGVRLIIEEGSLNVYAVGEDVDEDIDMNEWFKKEAIVIFTRDERYICKYLRAIRIRSPNFGKRKDRPSGFRQ